ncbi:MULTISPECIES: NAD-dependent protein deacetylase [Nitrincola]|uniref:protein acetyllysine N-acetyltransferase n=1 Tax=Nitrincola nitratireducens TaxID=1229521 RepID=W9V732_9GAMM|nr:MULTISPECIES: NAD-dependent protein deacetylase [Nitrincola]EXJ11882.1 NAD-dependent deacetylase [Nitrincola nitratireducens]
MQTISNHQNAALALAEFIQQHPSLFILTGAGVSTDSGIPDYRDEKGNWKRKQPVQHQDFMNSHATRQRYWGRSLIGWPIIRDAQPNACHQALARLERLIHVPLMVTQNVDRLHQAAGSQKVIDLHGRSDRAICMNCGFQCPRDEIHHRSALLNPHFLHFIATAAPDGDADLEVDFSNFDVPDCPTCGGILKPDVVFFGDNVPKQHVETALSALDVSDAMLVVGSSLMVYSGYRFCKRAQEWNKPIASLTLGKTRADDITHLKLSARIDQTLMTTLALME